MTTQISMDEVKKKRYELQGEIEILLQKFNTETGALVTEIIISNEEMGSRCMQPDYLVMVNCKVEVR